MSKVQAKRKIEPEFLFVFNAQPNESQTQNATLKSDGTLRVSNFKKEEANSLRQALISELREYGC